jgi:hypothetical protein
MGLLIAELVELSQKKREYQSGGQDFLAAKENGGLKVMI